MKYFDLKTCLSTYINLDKVTVIKHYSNKEITFYNEKKEVIQSITVEDYKTAEEFEAIKKELKEALFPSVIKKAEKTVAKTVDKVLKEVKREPIAFRFTRPFSNIIQNYDEGTILPIKYLNSSYCVVATQESTLWLFRAFSEDAEHYGEVIYQ